MELSSLLSLYTEDGQKAGLTEPLISPEAESIEYSDAQCAKYRVTQCSSVEDSSDRRGVIEWD